MPKYLNGTNGDDNILGTFFDDFISSRAGNDSINGKEGNDTLNGEAGDDFITGEVGNDILIGGIGVDNLNGGLGDDTYSPGLGNDFMFDYSNLSNSEHDVFLIEAPQKPKIEGNFGEDFIAGFTLGQDVINISGYTSSDVRPVADPFFPGDNYTQLRFSDGSSLTVEMVNYTGVELTENSDYFFV